MAKLSPEITATIEQLRQQLIAIVDLATATEFPIFDRHGENDSTSIVLEERMRDGRRSSLSFSIERSIIELFPPERVDPITNRTDEKSYDHHRSSPLDECRFRTLAR